MGVSQLSPVYFLQSRWWLLDTEKKGVRGEEEMGSDHCNTGICDPHTNRAEAGIPSFLLMPFSFHGGGNRVLQSNLPPHCSPAQAMPTNTRAIASRCTHMPWRRAHSLPQRRVTGVIISRQISASASLAVVQRATAWFTGHEPVRACRAFAYLVVSSCRGARAVSSAPQGPRICLDQVPASRNLAHPLAS